MNLTRDQQMGHQETCGTSASIRKEFFVLSAGAILLITGLAKVVGALGKAQFLDVPDPIFGIPFRHLMLLVGVLELIIAEVCLLTNKPKVSTEMVLWISSLFLVYRIGLWAVGWHRPCRCLGSLTDALHISPEAADMAAKCLLAYLLVGGVTVYLLEGRAPQVPSR
jgi:hypothetical protein